MTHFIALCGVLIISFSAIFVRLAAVAPSTGAFFRAVYALPVLYVLWKLTSRRDLRTARERWLAVAAGLLLAIDLNLWHRAILMIGAGLGTVLANTQVIFLGLAVWLIYGERPSRAAIAGVPIVFSGGVLISGLGQADAYGQQPLLGVVYGLLTGLTYTGFLLLLRASNRSLSVPTGPLLDATAGTAIGGLLFGLADGQLDVAWTWPGHGWLLMLALLPQVIGWLLINHALPRLPAIETSVLLLLQPMGSVLWGYLLFAEVLSWIQWLGAGLLLTGVALVSVVGRAEPSPPSSQPLEEPVASSVGNPRPARLPTST